MNRKRAVRRTVTAGLVGRPANARSTSSVTVPSCAPSPGTMLNEAGNVRSRTASLFCQPRRSGCIDVEAPRDTVARIEVTRSGASVSTSTITNVAGDAHALAISATAARMSAPIDRCAVRDSDGPRTNASYANGGHESFEPPIASVQRAELVRKGITASTNRAAASTCAKCDASSSHSNRAPGRSTRSRSPTIGGTIGSRRA